MQNSSNSKELSHKSLKNLKIGPRTSELNPIKPKWIQMSKFEQKSALYEKLCFFKRINLALVLCGAVAEIGQKWDFRALFNEIYMKCCFLSYCYSWLSI
jgi:hypothetical protein